MTGQPPWEPIADEEALAALYGEPGAAALKKEVPALTPAYRAMVEASRFCVLATVGPEGLDCSPRGDREPVVRVLDDRTLLLPDRRGNNRIDSLRNIVRDPRVALLFIIPGITETLRVNGTAIVTRDGGLCAEFPVDGKLPRSVIVIRIRSVYWQCARALVRSDLWNRDRWPDISDMPTPGRMLSEASCGTEDGAAYDADLRARQARTMY